MSDDKRNRRYVTTGAGDKAGRRPVRLRTDKRELERIIRALYAYGLGGQIISKLLGYSPSQISRYARDWGLAKANPHKALEWYESLLPSDLKADIRLIRTRSDVYLERAKNKDEPLRPRVHICLDKPRKVLPNSAGTVRPQET